MMFRYTDTNKICTYCATVDNSKFYSGLVGKNVIAMMFRNTDTNTICTVLVVTVKWL